MNLARSVILKACTDEPGISEIRTNECCHPKIRVSQSSERQIRIGEVGIAQYRISEIGGPKVGIVTQKDLTEPCLSQIGIPQVGEREICRCALRTRHTRQGPNEARHVCAVVLRGRPHIWTIDPFGDYIGLDTNTGAV